MYMRALIGIKGAQDLMAYEWKEGKWENHEIVIERFKVKIQPKSRNQRNK